VHAHFGVQRYQVTMTRLAKKKAENSISPILRVYFGATSAIITTGLMDVIDFFLLVECIIVLSTFPFQP
jgi:hypothetical protein